MIRRCQLDFDDEAWAHISDDAKDIIRQLIVADPSKRLTAEQALEHPWMRSRHIPSHKLSSALLELRRFNNARRLRAAVNTIMYVLLMRRCVLVDYFSSHTFCTSVC